MINRIFGNIWKLMKENKFQSINGITNDLICSICNKLMIKACYTPCGCRYCSDCIENYLDGKVKFCPGKSRYCQMRMINYENDIIVDYPINIRISEIVVKCPNKCEFTDELSLIENHMRTCKKDLRSPYFEIKCKNNEVTNGEMKEHFCTEIYCHTKFIDFINNLRNEMESIKNEILKLQSENKCLKEQLSAIKIESINNQMKNEECENKIKNNLLEIEELNEKMVAVKKEKRTLKEKLEDIEKSQVIKKTQRKSEQPTLKIDKIKEKCQQKPNKEIIIDKNIDLVKKSNICENKNNLSIKMVGTERNKEKNNFGQFKWKIEDFSLKKKTDIYSEPFYSHKNGYKMCLSVWIDGDFVQVWFYLMKGEFDEDLLWPFKHGITIDIINQMDGTVHISKTINCDDHPNDQRWNKPKTQRNYAIFFYSIKKSKEIIRNNQLLIKCKINI